MRRRKPSKLIVSTLTLILFITSSAKFRNQRQVLAQQQDDQASKNNPQLDLQARQTPPSWSTSPPSLQPPNPIVSASYLSLDGMSLVIIFDKPVNLSASIESAERRLLAANSDSLGAGESSQREINAVKPTPGNRLPRAPDSSTLLVDADDQSVANALANGQDADHQRQLDSSGRRLFTCPDPRLSLQPPETSALVQGIQICARLLTKKTLKLLHKYRLYNCIWPTQVQFIIQLAKSVPVLPANGSTNNIQNGAPIRVAFKRSSLSSIDGFSSNEREVSVELNRMPLEGLGVPLAPRLALTGPNQVPPCGQFTLSAHLSSPYGTQPGDSVSLSWTVERIGLTSLANSISNSSSSGSNQSSINGNDESVEIKWRALQQLVVNNRGNNLILDAQLLQQQPQVYLFHVTATFSTSLSQVALNATHQVGKIDFEAPIGTIYGSHLLGQQHQVNPNQEVALLADIQVPDCANNIKQVGVYWQVSDSRVKFEQTYAPFYLIKKNALPEQTQIEFRLNLFYGIRVKKYASAGTLISAGDSILDASINDGTLVMSIGSHSYHNHQLDSSKQLELYATSDSKEADRHTYQWSCFDGKTAQQCQKNSQANNSTRYEIGSILAPNLRQQLPPNNNPNDQPNDQSSAARNPLGQPASQPSGSTPLLDRQQQRQSNLKLPLSWLEPEAQLWFGLQRFDRQQVVAAGSGQQPPQAKTEYALISLQQQAISGPTMSIGPVLVGRSRQRATIRNPLTGAIVLIAGAPVVVVGRLSPSQQVGSFAWHLQNGLQPLYWTVRNSTNSATGEQELVSELHLNQNLLVAHAHHQIQLIACSKLSGAKSSASLSLDIIQSVSQCRVEVTRSPVSNSLAVSVEFCNIPLGLSPATYQVYVLDTSASDGLIESSRQPEPANGATQDPEQQDEYANEADESFLESQAEPLTTPQLSPVFILNGVGGALGLLAATSAGSNKMHGRARVRFAARVCDRIQSCRMFYSQPVGPEVLQPANNRTSAAGQLLQPQQRDDLERSQSVALQAMLDGAKRANMAGNSIAAISVLNGLITLAGKMLARAGVNGDPSRRQSSERLVSGVEPGVQTISKLHEDKLRELNQLAMRDCLHFASLSVQRHFHYTDSGQTNLVTQTLGKILASASSGLEFKFRALRLLAQVTGKSIEQAVNLKLNCLADSRSLQSSYESVFGTFSQYALPDYSHQDHQAHKANHNRLISSNSTRPSAVAAHFVVAPDGSNPLALVTAAAAASNASSAAASTPWALAQQQPPPAPPQSTSGHPNQANNSRRKREEAILAYLRYARHSYRALVAAAAIQLPLGATHQLAYLAGGQLGQQQAAAPARGGDSEATAASATSTSRLPASASSAAARAPRMFGFPSMTRAALSSASPSSQLLQSAATTASAQTQVAILSSLAHQTQLSPTEPIDVDLNEFGSVSISFVDQASLAAKLRAQLERQTLRCRNESAAATSGSGSNSGSAEARANGKLPVTCSSFVLALTTFTGKAPFRSLDEGARWLRVPVVELSLLSPVDGSNLLDLLAQAAASGDTSELQASDFKVTITYTLPLQPVQMAAEADGRTPQQSPASGNGKLRCYQFSEKLNEWTLSSQQPEAEESIQTNGLEESGVLNGEQSMRRIKCSFNSLGVYGAFSGRPPPGESTAQLTIILGLVGVFGLVAVFSILGCFASTARAASKRRNSDGSDEGDEGDGGATTTETGSSSDVSINRHQHQRVGSQAFGKYPL